MSENERIRYLTKTLRSSVDYVRDIDNEGEGVPEYDLALHLALKSVADALDVLRERLRVIERDYGI